MAVAKKYLNYDEIKALIGEIIIPKTFEVMSQDSYNETLISQTISQTGKSAELAMAAINMAVIGIGNKRYGNFKMSGQIVDIAQLLNACGVKTRLAPNSILGESDLTVQRLCRFYRHHIREWIRANRYPTYMFRKYSDHDADMNEILFRGAEYLDDLTEEQTAYLKRTLENMDAKLNTQLTARFNRVREAITGLKPI